jgi:hypothetical protein
MRTLRRFYRRQLAELRLAPRRRVITGEISRELGVPVRLERTGARGHDSIYYAMAEKHPLGVLRVLNPFLARKSPPADMPFVSLPPELRLTHEWEAYGKLAPRGLAPRPLWRCDDAILCTFIEAPRFSATLNTNPMRLWELAATAARGIRAIHDADLVHMDACFANLLGDDRSLPVWIDFEYGPAPGLSETAARAYDYLRLIESSLKFLTPDQRREPGRWIQAMDSLPDDEARAVDLKPLQPALQRLLADAALVAELRQIFPRLGAS